MKVCKTFQWDCSHCLDLPYESKCKNMHGHTYKIEVELEGGLDDNGMVMDFVKLKELVNSISLDHSTINENEFFKSMKWNPTAENMVRYIKLQLDAKWQPTWPRICRIRVWETPNSYAEETWNATLQEIIRQMKVEQEKTATMKRQLDNSAAQLMGLIAKIKPKQ